MDDTPISDAHSDTTTANDHPVATAVPVRRQKKDYRRRSAAGRIYKSSFKPKYRPIITPKYSTTPYTTGAAPDEDINMTSSPSTREVYSNDETKNDLMEIVGSDPMDVDLVTKTPSSSAMSVAQDSDASATPQTQPQHLASNTQATEDKIPTEEILSSHTMTGIVPSDATDHAANEYLVYDKPTVDGGARSVSDNVQVNQPSNETAVGQADTSNENGKVYTEAAIDHNVEHTRVYVGLQVVGDRVETAGHCEKLDKTEVNDTVIANKEKEARIAEGNPRCETNKRMVIEVKDLLESNAVAKDGEDSQSDNHARVDVAIQVDAVSDDPNSETNENRPFDGTFRFPDIIPFKTQEKIHKMLAELPPITVPSKMSEMEPNSDLYFRIMEYKNGWPDLPPHTSPDYPLPECVRDRVLTRMRLDGGIGAEVAYTQMAQGLHSVLFAYEGTIHCLPLLEGYQAKTLMKWFMDTQEPNHHVDLINAMIASQLIWPILHEQGKDLLHRLYELRQTLCRYAMNHRNSTSVGREYVYLWDEFIFRYARTLDGGDVIENRWREIGDENDTKAQDP